MISSPIALYRNEIEDFLDHVGSVTLWEDLTPQNRRRAAIRILAGRSDTAGRTMARLLANGAPNFDSFTIIENLTGSTPSANFPPT